MASSSTPPSPLDSSPREDLWAEWLEPLTKWQTFGLYLPGIKQKDIDKIEEDKTGVESPPAVAPPPPSVDINKLRRIITEVIRTNYATFNKSLKENISQISREMFARGLLSESVKEYPSYDSLIREFEAGLNFKKSVKAIEEHCKKFIESILTQKGPPESHAREIAEEWREEVLKTLHFEFNVL
uniref:Uncharacterized protein n=1 Tax=Amphimedon queenslandica TaxID=400682 RepID=A0A1X7TZD2_AMPQE